MLLRKPRSPVDYAAALDTADWIVQLRWFAIVVNVWQLRSPQLVKGILAYRWLALAVSVTVLSNLALMIHLRLQRRYQEDAVLLPESVQLQLSNLSTVTDFDSLIDDNRKHALKSSCWKTCLVVRCCWML